MEDSKPQTANSAPLADITPKVTGIGGIFFFLYFASSNNVAL